ncbi:YdgH/BhsA/McbA-like domain containing protein, partial [Enterobacter bugandensis]|uniref:YdgH/BhsA/McbA-like domain containing protein n=1 Tax=Enterobacter bugandensis TaxID=881260 RepID=UPI0015F762FC
GANELPRGDWSAGVCSPDLLNKATAAQMVPFDSIKFTGNYGNMTEVSYQVAKRAAKKGAKYYHITRQWQERGNNVTISADLYK